MRKISAYGRRQKRQPQAAHAGLHSPVGKAATQLHIAECIAQTDKFMLRISTRAYLTQDGERDIELLATLAVLLGLGAEIGISTAEDAPETRRMHAALRTVLQMSVDGGGWKASQAKVLHEAAGLAATAFRAHSEIGLRRFEGASELGQKIRMGTARMSDVVGPEVYKKTAGAMLAGAASY